MSLKNRKVEGLIRQVKDLEKFAVTVTEVEMPINETKWHPLHSMLPGGDNWEELLSDSDGGEKDEALIIDKNDCILVGHYKAHCSQSDKRVKVIRVISEDYITNIKIMAQSLYFKNVTAGERFALAISCCFYLNEEISEEFMKKNQDEIAKIFRLGNTDIHSGEKLIMSGHAVGGMMKHLTEPAGSPWEETGKIFQEEVVNMINTEGIFAASDVQIMLLYMLDFFKQYDPDAKTESREMAEIVASLSIAGKNYKLIRDAFELLRNELS